jgi:hypothetical protein
VPGARRRGRFRSGAGKAEYMGDEITRYNNFCEYSADKLILLRAAA